MRAVLDTNVLVSGVFFSGIPATVLAAWASGRFAMAASPLILDEYRRVASELATGYPDVDIAPILDLIVIHAEIIEDRALPAPVCRDPDDDKFLACAGAAGATLVSGDKDLLAVDGALGVRVVTPRAFAASLLR